MNTPLRLEILERLPSVHHRSDATCVVETADLQLWLEHPRARRRKPEVHYFARIDGAWVERRLYELDEDAYDALVAVVAVRHWGLTDKSPGRDLGGGWAIRRVDDAGGAR